MKKTQIVVGFLLLLVTLPAWAQNFKPGDELWTRRSAAGLVYHHSGVYVGNGQVVHANSTPVQAAKRMVKGRALVRIVKTSMRGFTEGHSVRRGPAKPRFKRSVIVKRALGRVGNSFAWDPVRKNCQHFSTWAVTGNSYSPEASKYKRIFTQLHKKALKAVKKKLGLQKNTSARLKNCSKKKAYVCVYNGGDKVRLATRSRPSVSSGRWVTVRCSDNGKKRCLVRLSKNRKCSVFLKVHSLSRSSTRYIKYSKGKFKLSSSCR